MTEKVSNASSEAKSITRQSLSDDQTGQAKGNNVSRPLFSGAGKKVYALKPETSALISVWEKSIKLGDELEEALELNYNPLLLFHGATKVPEKVEEAFGREAFQALYKLQNEIENYVCDVIRDSLYERGVDVTEI